MLVSKKISIFVLRVGWWLIVWAAIPSEGHCWELPDAPQPQNTLPGKGNNGQSMGAPMGPHRSAPAPGQPACAPSASNQQPPQNCQSNDPNNPDPLNKYVTSGKNPAPPLTPMGKLRLAGKDIIDPFNLLTIAADSAIAIGSDSHSSYGPGMAGFGKYAGVALTGDITGEFFGTFLIPSLTHQDPRYHRMQHATIPRRIGHTIVQVVWTKGDNGQNMPNYGSVFGLAAANILGNLYVPGEHTTPGATTARWATGLATAPIDNILTEFLPDVARHVNVRVVLFQRILNSVARPETQ
jgi:hypothetical protein